MSDITVINDTQQSELVTNGLAKNGELYLKADGSTDAGAIVVYDSGSWRTFANEASPSFSNQYSVDFDGTDDYIDLGTSSDLAPANITLMCWFKASGTLGSYNFLMYQSNTMFGAFRLTYRISNKFECMISGPWGYSNIESSSTYTLTDWHHVAMTYDQSYLRLYVDGVEANSVAQSNALSYNGSNTWIGKGNAAQNAEGVMDECAVFNTALSSSDISSIYNSGVPADISSYSPVGWWRMGDNDSGTGTTITDQGSGGNDGTLTNGPTFSTDVPS
jgi:hypothetical protein